MLCVWLVLLLPLAYAQCENGWLYYKETHSCFKYFHQDGTFWSSDLFCHSHGAHLVMIKTKGESDFVEKLMIADNAGRKLAKMYSPWVGLVAPLADCNFRWLDGSPMNRSVVQFGPTQPDSCRSLEFCSHIWPPNPTYPPNPKYNQNKLFNDLACWKTVHRIMCKKPAEPNEIEVPFPCEAGWSYFEDTNTCFKNFIRSATFDEAKSHCNSFGSVLASITTSGETQFLKNLVSSGRIRNWLDMAWVGLTTPNRDCNFEWLDGTPLNKSVVDFAKNNPSACRRIQFCAKFDGLGQWYSGHHILDDFECHKRLNAVLCMKRDVKKPIEKVVCRAGWVQLNGTNTCVKNQNGQLVETQKSLDTALEKKCTGMPMKSYFDRPTLTCFAESSDCYAVPYPGVPSRSANYDHLRRMLERKGVLTGSSQPCVFEQEGQCERGKVGSGAHCFWLTEKEATWSAASNECQQKDGSLFVPHNDNDMQRALEFVLSAKANSTAVWLGFVLTDEWRTIDGTELDYLRWRPVVDDKLNSDALGTKFLYEIVSQKKGSFAAYIQPEKVENSLVGLCNRKAKRNYSTSP